MTKYALPRMRPELAVCPRCGDDANGRIGIHSRPERRYKCHRCGKTFSDTQGTPLFGLKRPLWQVIMVLTLLAYGCPVPAIVAAFGLDERTVWDWRRKAGEQAKAVQETMVCAGQVEVGQVQGDEFYLKTQCGAVWVATAMSVFSRLFLWGAVSIERNTALVSQVVSHVKAAAQPDQPMLWAVDGFGAWTQAILHLFRRPHYRGQPGRPKLMVWPQLHIVQVIKRTVGRRLVAVERRLVHGTQQHAEAIVAATQVGVGCFNTAYIERLNATFRGWLPIATRRSRTPAARRCQVEAALFWTAVVYNFSHVHASLQATPAMAAGLTDHVWSIDQLLRFRVQRE
jgi:transposase-like protein